jgi:nicotinamide phosphoribosyltransferase
MDALLKVILTVYFLLYQNSYGDLSKKFKMNNPLTQIDFYKADHRRQYPEGTALIYSNFTPRGSRLPDVDGVVFFGLQAVIIDFLLGSWQKNFFDQPKEQVIAKYKRRMDNALGKDAVPVDHLERLHDLGYLPLRIKALPEGTIVPLRVPVFTITNTRDDEFWLVNYLESALSNKCWKGITSATIALQFLKNFVHYYESTVGDYTPESFVKWQGHDFSYRGMSGEWDADISGSGHLLSFYGTDTVSAIDFLEEFYDADSDKEMVGGSVPATEHSVMSMGISVNNEFETFARLITDLYPSGPVSIVSDTMDYWTVLTDFAPRMKEEIMSREGHPYGLDKVVFRPDSGDPYRIIVGYFSDEITQIDGKFYLTEEVFAEPDSLDYKPKPLEQWELDGSVETLWKTFGGHTTARGFRQLCSKVGLIYGDSITLERQVKILDGLRRKGFASTNVVFGIGSYTYEYVTRDTFGHAMKATYGEAFDSDGAYLTEDRVAHEIYKDPKTDSGLKKSARGLLRVDYDDEHNIVLRDRCTWKEEAGGLLETVFEDGKLVKRQSLSEIRARLQSQL